MDNPENEDTRRAKAGVGDDACDAVLHGDGSKFQALREAILDRQLSIGDCRLYAELLAQPTHEREGALTCRPSRVRLARGSGVHLQSIRRSTANLIQAGYIEVSYGAGRSTNRFTLLRVSTGSAPAPGSAPVPGNKVAASEGANALPLLERRGSARATTTGGTGSAPAPQLLREPQSVAPSRSSDGFVSFWNAYPRKEGKAAALKSWERKRLDRIADQILADVLARVADPGTWTDPKFIPLPATYLNGDRWQDEWQRASRPAAGAIPVDHRTDAEIDEQNAAEARRFGYGP